MTGGLHLSGAKEPFAINDDLWKHRSSKMRCRTCMWFVRKNSGLAEAVKDIGRCRKNAPTMSGYPVVFVDDWCGNHKIDEVKF